MESNKGNVFIATMNLRGIHAKQPINTVKINVTSCQKKDNENRIAFSPMTPIMDGYKGFYCFENYYQSGKVYENIDSNKQINWWKKQIKGKKKYPLAKTNKILYCKYNHIDKNLDYIETRKQIYVPEYSNLIKDNEILNKLKNNIKKGINYTIYDLDGPRLEDGTPTSNLVSLDYLKEKINDINFPFGHGYIICALLLDIDLNELINN